MTETCCVLCGKVCSNPIPAIIQGTYESIPVRVIVTDAKRTATAQIRVGTVIIRIPSRWSNDNKHKVCRALVRRIERRVLRGIPLELKPLVLSPGKTIICGKPYTIVIEGEKDEREKTNAHQGEETIVVRIPPHKQTDEKYCTTMIRKTIVSRVYSTIEHLVESINQRYFRVPVKKIRIAENKVLWGSYSARGTLSLHFRLLFAPLWIFEYVIIHELAHGKVHNHSPRFWKIVENALPTYPLLRRWLKRYGPLFPFGVPCEYSLSSSQSQCVKNE